MRIPHKNNLKTLSKPIDKPTKMCYNNNTKGKE